jgi:hypothetical protein
MKLLHSRGANPAHCNEAGDSALSRSQSAEQQEWVKVRLGYRDPIQGREYQGLSEAVVRLSCAERARLEHLARRAGGCRARPAARTPHGGFSSWVTASTTHVNLMVWLTDQNAHRRVTE